MTTMEERVSRLEGGYEHLATKADVMAVQAAIQAEITRVQSATQAETTRLQSATQAETTRLQAEITRLQAKLPAVKGTSGGLRGEVRLLITGIGLGLVALNIVLKFVG